MAEPSEIAEKDLSAGELLDRLESEETLEIKVNRESNQITLRDPRNGKIVRLEAKVEDETDLSEDVELPPPLTPEEFEKGIRRLLAIGMTFDVDLMPDVVAKDDKTFDLNPEEFESIQEAYPQLPGEVGLVAHNTLTGTKFALPRLGGEASFEKKAQIVSDLILTTTYREEFFFRHALKFPTFEMIDWEVTLRMSEKGVAGSVNVPYAVLQLSFRDKNQRTAVRSNRNYTVAVNRELIDRHIAVLSEVRSALNEAFSHSQPDREKDGKE